MPSGVAAAVERAGVEAAEVADPGERIVIRRSRNSHMRAPRRVTATPHGHPLADLEVGDRLAGAADARTLPGDRRRLLGRGLEDRSWTSSAPPMPMLTIFCKPRDLHRNCRRRNCDVNSLTTSVAGAARADAGGGTASVTLGLLRIPSSAHSQSIRLASSVGVALALAVVASGGRRRGGLVGSGSSSITLETSIGLPFR